MLIFVAVMIAAVTIFLRRRRVYSQRERRQEEDGGEEGERASDPLKKDPEGDRPLLEEQTSSEQPSSRKM